MTHSLGYKFPAGCNGIKQIFSLAITSSDPPVTERFEKPKQLGSYTINLFIGFCQVI